VNNQETDNSEIAKQKSVALVEDHTGVLSAVAASKQSTAQQTQADLQSRALRFTIILMAPSVNRACSSFCMLTLECAKQSCVQRA